MTMSERREDQRHRVLKAGKIFINDGRSVIDCCVRNVSEAGAMLSLDALAVPAEFDLLVDGVTHHCAVIWRRPDRIGVSFENPSDDALALAMPRFRKDDAIAAEAWPI